MTLIFMSSCTSAPQPDTSDPPQTEQKSETYETSHISSETAPAETLSTGVYLNGELQAKGDISYTYNADYGL